MISWPTAIVLIVLITAVARFMRSRHRGSPRLAKRDQAEIAQSKAREAELEKEVTELRERIQVLERIATDGRGAKAIAEEIESLRDK